MFPLSVNPKCAIQSWLMVTMKVKRKNPFFMPPSNILGSGGKNILLNSSECYKNKFEFSQCGCGFLPICSIIRKREFVLVNIFGISWPVVHVGLCNLWTETSRYYVVFLFKYEPSSDAHLMNRSSEQDRCTNCLPIIREFIYLTRAAELWRLTLDRQMNPKTYMVSIQA